MKLLRAYSHLFTRHRRVYALGLLALLATNALYMYVPRLIGAAVDRFAAGATRADVIRFASIVVVVAIAQAITRVLSRIWVLGVSRRVEYDLKGMLHGRLVTLAPSFYHALSTGDLMSRLTNDVTLVRAMGGPGVLYFFNAVLIYVLGVAFMVGIDWRLTLVVLAPLPFMVWIVRGMAHKVRAYAVASREALSDLNTTVQENLAGAQVVRAFVLEEDQSRRFEARSSTYVDWALKESRTRAQMMPLIGLSGGLSFVGVLAVGGPRVAAGSLSLGELVAFMSYVTMMIFPTVALGWILSLLQRGAAALERLDTVLRAPQTIATSEHPATVPSNGVPTLADRIRVRHLTFAYSDTFAVYETALGIAPATERRPALVDVSLEVPAGGFVGLVGRVGSGKSTFLKVLPRLLEIDPGHVEIDGVDALSMDLGALRTLFAYVPQDDFLFNASVEENIAFGTPGAPAERIRTAAQTAGLEFESERVGLGMGTRVGERGANVSGGQRQRIALARALLTDSPVLLLDNALSNVDTETERRILNRLRDASRGRTVIAASNRITAIQDADRIVVMDRGRIVDQGTHDDLRARPGLYATMFEQQQLSARLEKLT